MQCSVCGNDFLVNPETGDEYIPITMTVEAWMVNKHNPGTYMICGDCVLKSFGLPGYDDVATPTTTTTTSKKKRWCFNGK